MKHSLIYGIIKSSLCLLLLGCQMVPDLHAQGTKSNWQFSGNIGLYGDFYSMDSDTFGAVAPRRPGSLVRLVADASVSYGRFSIPVSIILSSGQHSVILPLVPKGNWLDYIRNPANRVGIAPKYKWAQLLLGTQVPHYSELSVGDLPVFGAGLRLTPGKFRLSVFAGTTQLAIEEDTARRIQGIYARKIYSGKIGVGKEESSHLYLIASLLEDDTLSLQKRPSSVIPQKGTLSALDYRIRFGKKYYLKGEVAASAFTRDVRSPEASAITSPVNFPPEIFSFRESSRVSYGSVMSFVKEGKIFRIKLVGRYIGDGFVPLGYPFMQTDRAEVTIDPSFNLFQSRVQFSGSIGRRIDNLSGARLSTSTQTIASANLNWQMSKRFSLAGSFSNFGMRNPLVNDTLRIELISLSWSVNPTYTLSTASNLHIFSAMYSANAFRDFNTISGELNDNDAKSAVFSYGWSKVRTPLNTGVTLSYFENNTYFGKLSIRSAQINLGYKFFKKKLNATTGLTYAENQLDAKDPGVQLIAMIGLKYKVKKRLSFNATGSINLFSYGAERPGISYQENLLRTSVTYKF